MKKNTLFKQIALKQLLIRAEISNKQFLEGKFISQEKLEIESKNW
jgi:hypothetical protein